MSENKISVTSNNSYAQALFELANLLSEDDLWAYQIIQIHFSKDKEVILIPRVGNHKIIFGMLKNLEEKFQNLRLFYEQAIRLKGWNSYTDINLKFKNQIVCTKK